MRTSHSWLFGAALIGALVAGPMSAAPAFAHDELVGSDPSTDTVLDQMPETIELTFSGELMELGAIVQVRDAEGVDHALSDPEIAVTVVTVAVDPDVPDGSYAIVWRVVSSDGHPISGSIPFVVGEPTPVAQATDAASAAPGPAEPAEPDQSVAHESAADDPWSAGGPARIAFVAFAGAALALGLVVMGITLGRRRTAAAASAEQSQRDPAGSAHTENETEQE